MNRKLAAAITAITVGISLGATAEAAPNKPIKKSYTATTTMVDPTPITGETGGNCSPTLDQAKHETSFAIPFPGVLKVDLTGFQGDWALALVENGEKIADHDNDVSEPIDTPSSITMKFKKKTTIVIRACNFAGGPTAKVDALLTPTKK